jgi:uncharacterized protein YggE
MPSDEDLPAGVTVVGTGRVGVAPDVVLLGLAAVVLAESVRSALDGASAAATSVSAALRATGVADRDLRTSGMRVEQAWQHGPEGAAPHGFEATVRVTARVRDVGSAGEVVAAAVEAGGDAVRVEQMTLSVDDPEAAQRAARELAFEDARSKATHYAMLADRRLAAVHSVVEHSAGGVAPFESGWTEYAPLQHDARAAPIEQGDQDVRVGVTVRWSLA